VPSSSATPKAGEQVILLPTPHRGMQHVLRNAKRTNLVRAGRRWRKTTLMARINVERACYGEKRFHGAPTYEQARICWDEMKRMAGGVFRFHESRLEAEAPNGGRVRCRSLDNPDNARGFTADGWTIDEFDFIDPKAYREVIQPQLMDTGGDLWMGSTPNGMGLMFEEEERLRHVSDAAIFYAPSLGCRIENGKLIRDPHPMENSDLKFEEVERLFYSLSLKAFEQEVLALYRSMEGQVFPDFSRERHVLPAHHDSILGAVSVGIDFGYRTCAWVAVQVDTGGTVRVFADGEMHNISTGDAAGRLAGMSWAPGIDLVGCDPAGGGVNLQSGIDDVQVLRGAFPQARVTYSMLPTHRSPEWRAAKIRDLLWSAAGTRRLVVDPSCVSTIRALEASIYPKLRLGSGEKQEPVKDGVVDHARDALGYLLVNLLHREAPIMGGTRPW
jgi:hypothetical protein